MPGKQKNSYNIRLLFFILVTLLFLITSSGCGLDISFHENTGEIYSLSTDIDQDIEFIAELSVPLEGEDSLALDMVDEIKGIPNNITRYYMTMMDDLHYHVIISAMAGSNVSYRYSRVGTVTQNEMTVSGNPVRYRLFHVDKTTQVKDIVSGWTENDYPGLVGDLLGTIVEKGSGSPISDVLICIAGYQTFTNSLGKFSVLNIPEGIHNFVGFSIDGSYKVFQQSILINHDLDTIISIELTKLPEVTVKFIVNSPPSFGNVPIRIAGSLYQFGNTFVDLNGGINLLASRMPVLTELSTGNNYFEIKLHEGNDLHYVYTLGDGFWNTEQGLDDIKGYRQLIVPKEDTTIYDTIQSWQNDAFQYLKFSLAIPENTPNNDIISIQFGNESWFEPIPMVSVGKYQWDFSLLTPFPVSNNLNYRFCRNYICDLYASAPGIIGMDQLLTGDNNSVEVKISDWPSWTPVNVPPTIFASEIPKKESDYLTGVEFLPDYQSSYLDSYQKILQELKEKGVNTIILHPSHSLEQISKSPFRYLKPRSNILPHDVVDISSTVDSLGMNLILAPIVITNSDQLTTYTHTSSSTQEKSLFAEHYKEMIISYAQLASTLNHEYYMIDLSLYTYASPQERNSENFFEIQPLPALSALISEVKAIFSGQVVCSLPVRYIGTLPSDWIGSCDALYLEIDLVLPQQMSIDDVKHQIGSLLDNKILPDYVSTHKPIFIEISTPAIVQEYSYDLDQLNFLSFTPQNSVSFVDEVDLDYQSFIYNAFLNQIIGRDWINGVVAGDFYAPLKLTDASSSINGKPAMDVLWYWYTGVR